MKHRDWQQQQKVNISLNSGTQKLSDVERTIKSNKSFHPYNPGGVVWAKRRHGKGPQSLVNEQGGSAWSPSYGRQ